jgi:hypothetical protein
MSRDRLERLIEAIENPVVEQNGHSAYYIPHDVAKWFPGAARSLLNGDIRALGLFRSPGRPVESNERTVDLAEKALTAKMQGKTWAEINLMIFGQKSEPPDERYIRTLVDRYKPLVLARLLNRRWVSWSEERKQRAFLKNSRRGKPGL